MMGPETVPPLLWQYSSSMVKYLQAVCSAPEMDMSNLLTYLPEPSSCFNLEGPEMWSRGPASLRRSKDIRQKKRSHQSLLFPDHWGNRINPCPNCDLKWLEGSYYLRKVIRKVVVLPWVFIKETTSQNMFKGAVGNRNKIVFMVPSHKFFWFKLTITCRWGWGGEGQEVADKASWVWIRRKCVPYLVQGSLSQKAPTKTQEFPGESSSWSP